MVMSVKILSQVKPYMFMWKNPPLTEVEALDTVHLQFIILPFHPSAGKSKPLHTFTGKVTVNNSLKWGYGVATDTVIHVITHMISLSLT